MVPSPMSTPSTRYAFHLDASDCSGCKACQAACKDRNGLEVGRLYRRVYEVSGGGWWKEGEAWHTDAFAYNLSIACNHCERPICVEVCPTGAMQRRENGVVWVDAERCIGCRYCAWACPYGAPQFDAATGCMSKCDFCYEDLEHGRSPACVAACPLRVLNVVERDGEGIESAINVYPLPDAQLTEPSLYLVPPLAAQNGSTSTGHVANVEETGKAHDDEQPLVRFTVLFQAAVGLQVGLALTGLLWLQEVWYGRVLFGTILLPGFGFSLASVILSGSALLASLLHLGRPLRAWRALANWRTSPLSREIWLASVFFVLVALSGGVGVFGIDVLPAGAVMAWTGFVAAFGLAAVMSMAGVYRLRTITTWTRQRPTLVFLQTTVTLGGLGTAALLALVNQLAVGWTGWVAPAWQAATVVGIFGAAVILALERGNRGEQNSTAGLHHLPAAGEGLARIRPNVIRLHAAALLAAMFGLASYVEAVDGWTVLVLGLAWLLTLLAELQRRAAFYILRRL